MMNCEGMLIQSIGLINIPTVPSLYFLIASSDQGTDYGRYIDFLTPPTSNMHYPLVSFSESCAHGVEGCERDMKGL
jgi:hypothetical protein